jgi:hypothetical protein
MSEKENVIYMKDAPLARMGELWAKLYYHMAKEMLKFGKEGEQALRRAIRNYAIDRGETMKKQAEALGLPLNYETFQVTIKDMPFKEICEEMVKYYPDAKGTSPSEGFCAYAVVWSKYPDGWDIAKIYCDEFHHAKWAAFNPKFKVDMVSVITRGDPCCNLVSYIEGDEYDKQRQKTIEEICSKAKRYGFLIDTSEYGKLENACKKSLEKEAYDAF